MANKKDTSELEEQITENLRRAYRQRAEEEIPERFRALLEQLKGQENGQEAPDDER
jgi:hemerythrin-like domain-containing protein